MIHSKDRSGWIGASDTHMVMANWNTPSWRKWWAVKLGLATNDFTTDAMAAGTHWEGRILDHLGIKKRDRQIKMRHLRLRVNLDGETKNTIHEVKTTGKDGFVLSTAYWQQAQVEMYATGKLLVIDHYRLVPDDYKNYFNPVDPARLGSMQVLYDFGWIINKYLPRLQILAGCLKKGVFPDESHG